MSITPEHTTAEAMEMMRDRDREFIVVVDRDSREFLGTISRATLVERCVRGWHEPENCTVGEHSYAAGIALERVPV